MKKRNKANELLKFKKRFKRALALRGHAHKTLAELKEIFGFSRTALHQWRNGKKMPSIYSASLIAEKLHVNYEWLLTGKGWIEDNKMQSAAEVTLIEQYRNLTQTGRQKIMVFVFDECKVNEITLKNKDDRQTALKLVKAKK